MRKQQGVTQQELASRLRTTQSTVARWETPGYTGYSLRKLFDVAEQLGYVPHLRFVRVMPAETLERTFSEWGNLDMISIEIRKRTMNATALHSSQLIKLQEVPHD